MLFILSYVLVVTTIIAITIYNFYPSSAAKLLSLFGLTQ